MKTRSKPRRARRMRVWRGMESGRNKSDGQKRRELIERARRRDDKFARLDTE